MKTFAFALLALSFTQTAMAGENCRMNLKINGHFSGRHVANIVSAIEMKGYTVDLEGSDGNEGAEDTYQGEISQSHSAGLKPSIRVAIHKGDNYVVNSGESGKMSLFGNVTTLEVLEELDELSVCMQ